MVPRLAELIAAEEGYGIPGALPTRDDNPGDLRHSPHSFHAPGAPNAIGQIDSPADGWNDLVRQLNLYVQDHPTWTVADAIYEWAPPSDNNDTTAYLNYVVNGLGCTPTTLLSDALLIPGIGAYSDEPT
jgi:hypothetical protein